MLAVLDPHCPAYDSHCLRTLRYLTIIETYSMVCRARMGIEPIST